MCATDDSQALERLALEHGRSVEEIISKALECYLIRETNSDNSEIALTLHHSGREANLKTLAALLAQERRLVAAGDPAALAARYFAALWEIFCSVC
jgi:hypothetical protein